LWSFLVGLHARCRSFICRGTQWLIARLACSVACTAESDIFLGVMRVTIETRLVRELARNVRVESVGCVQSVRAFEVVDIPLRRRLVLLMAARVVRIVCGPASLVSERTNSGSSSAT